MCKGSSLLCSLVLVQACIVQLFLISSWQLTLTRGGLVGGKFLCQDPIGSPPFMSGHGREELDGHSDDPIFDEEQQLADEEGGLSGVDEYGSDSGGAPAEEEEEGWLPDYDGGGAKGNSSGSGGGGDVECPECGKSFKNDKSMFGHLRSHPNRGYKGAIPPVNKRKMSPETTAVASPSSPPPSRGQSSARCNGRPSLSELVLTYALLTFKYPDENGESSSQQVPPPAAAPSFCERQTNVVGVIQQEGAGSSNITAAQARADEYGGSILKIPKKKRNITKEVRDAHGKKAKFALLPPPPPKEKGPYICKHCYAEFSTHQALGGHMAGHHRDKKVQTLNDASSRAHQGMAAQSQDGKLQVKGRGDDDDGCRASGLSLRRGLLSQQLSMASNETRQSGQASGGQMIEMRQQQSGRTSDGLTLPAPAPAPAPAPTPTQADDRGGRRLLNIDLNAEATEQE